MNIVLIGMRGSGKTAVGKVLAQRLGRELIEMDELITQKAGLSIPEIVAKHGWEGFRDLEAEITAEVAERDNIVNATGGGVVTREQNIAKLKQNGMLVWLTADVDTLLNRIGDDEGRPLLKGKTRREDMEITLAERQPLYQKAADITIDTEGKTPEAVAETIVDTKICCLIGDPVEHSLSPLIHNAAYKALYAVLSDAQKKEADTIVLPMGGMGGGMHGGMGRGWGPMMQPGQMMMGPGYGQGGYGPGMMGPGHMMGPGYGWGGSAPGMMGPNMWGRGTMWRQ